MPATDSAIGPPLAGDSTPPAYVVVREVAPASDRPDAGQIILWAERRMFLKRRWRGSAGDGTEFGFDLESRLTDGGVILRTEAADYVVRQRPEPVYIIPLTEIAGAALAGWKLGNLHLPVEITGEEIRVVHDSAVLQLLEREGWS